MYIPEHYKNNDQKEILEFLKANAFGILVTGGSKLLATHIPLELIERNGSFFLEGHVARGNEQWKTFKNEKEVLAIFNGPHSYVSSSWYDFEEVPTWNYVAVHVYGKLKEVTGEAFEALLHRLINKYEATMKHPIKPENLSKKTMAQMRGIIGFEIEITDIQATYKLSQSHNDKNYHSVVEELEKTPLSASNEIAELMKKKRPKR